MRNGLLPLAGMRFLLVFILIFAHKSQIGTALESFKLCAEWGEGGLQKPDKA